jgi:hypothetical protein
MMSSVVPARLQFQCGHAALVTLPRVKGETAAQRNARVAREKSAALARPCDFCAPATPEVVVVNGQLAADGEAVVEPVAVDHVAPQAVETTEAAEAVETAEAVEAEVVEHPVVQEGAQPTAPGEPQPALQAKTARAAKPGRKRQTPRAEPPSDAVARGRRFLVEYQVERVLQAVDIRDALRQAAAFGAAEVVAITRED